MPAHDDNRSIGDLLGDLGRQVGTLVHRELDLARVEVSTSVGRLSRDAALVGIGGALVYAGVVVLLAAAVFGLVEAGLDPWLAALIVGALVLAVGGVIVASGLNHMKQTSLAPKQTAESVCENVEFVKEQMK
jgi:NADH:ubiquinone oxidoreductase subunit 6 (subunit J)